MSSKQGIVSMSKKIQEDCEELATKMDGQPFNGRTMAEGFGNCLAMIDALARAVEILAKED